MSRLLCLLLAALCSLAAAAEPRPDWLRRELYAFHHPWAAQGAAELATKMRRMAADPFSFLRGTAHLFYRDMALLPPPRHLGEPVPLNGDAHLANFGCFVDGEGRAVFGLDDFDEAARGPAAWDLRRLASSLVLVAHARALDDAAAGDAVDAMTTAYLARLAAFGGGEPVRLFRLDHDTTRGEVRDCVDDAARPRRAKWLAKHTRDTREGRRFEDDEELAAVAPARRDALLAALAAHARGAPALAPKDVRQKLGSGLGSLGRLRYWVLVEGNSAAPDDDLVLELKQGAPSSVAAASGGDSAQRVLSALRAQQTAPDPLAAALRVDGVDYLLREHSPLSADLRLDKLGKPKALAETAALAGQALAQAHALAASPAAIARLAGTPPAAAREELRRFALDYARQVEQDWQDFKRLPAQALY